MASQGIEPFQITYPKGSFDNDLALCYKIKQKALLLRSR
jgi:hypothetical protein